MADQTYNELRSQLQKHKENERIYRDKLKEVNSTRSKINDQLDMLHQTYDKKIKNLQHRLEQLRQHNQTLTKQNILFRTEIDTYQTRLVEKEKIIALLLQQKKDVNHVNSSDRSKSEKTDSLKANEEEKIFKKQVPFKDEIETSPIKNSLKLENQPPVYKEEAEKEILNEDVDEKIKEVRRVVAPPPPKKKKEPLQIGQPQEQAHRQQPTREIEAEHPEPVSKRVPPPPPANKKTTQRKAPPHPKRQVNRVQEETGENVNDSQLLMSYFSANSHQNLSDSREHNLEVKHAHEPFGVVSDHQFRQEQNNGQAVDTVVQQETSPTSQAYKNEGYYVGQQEGRQNEIYRQQLPIEQNLDQVEETHPVQYLEQQYNPQQELQVQQVQNDFLSHFTHRQDDRVEELTRPKAIQKKQKKQHKKYHQTSFQPQHTEQSVSNSDFFSQLSNKQEGEVPHHALDIEESSIDHADRDSSLISNEQPYFAEDGVFRQEQQRPKPKNVKMTKKKGKRDQIKVADPSLFE